MNRIKLVSKNLLIHSQTRLINKCRICKENCLKKGFLYKCTNANCLAIHWDVKSLRREHGVLFKKKDFTENKQLIEEKIRTLMQEAGFLYPKGENRF